MHRYLRSGLIKAGLALFILGSGPLIVVIIAAAVGLWPDPNPNPIGLGLLAAATFWPSVICVVLGVFRVRGQQRADPT